MPFVSFDPFRPWHWGTVNVPATRGPMRPQSMEVYARQRLATDAIGSTTVTLTNVVPGSRYRIERAGDGSLATPTGNAEGVAAGATVVLTLDYYAAGSANNNLRIKVRKATSDPRYKPYETQATVGADPQSIFIAQQPD